MHAVKKIAAVAAIGGGLLLGAATPAMASPVVTGGLVNVTVTDVANGNTILSYDNIGVNAALAIAANVCDTNVNVLATQLGGSSATCTNTITGQKATLTQALG